MRRLTYKDYILLVVAVICLGLTIYMTVTNMHLTAVAGVCVFGVIMFTLWQRQLAYGYTEEDEDETYDLIRDYIDAYGKLPDDMSEDPTESDEYLELLDEFETYKRKARKRIRSLKAQIEKLESEQN